MLVTMFTDASLVLETGSGGWAMWAKSERGTIRASGRLKGTILNSGEAEAKALANGIDVLVKSDIFQPGDQVLAQLDNVQVIKALQLGPICPAGKAAITHVNALSCLVDFELTPRHIKAHVGVDKPRNWVHDQCDRAARRHARSLHRERVGGVLCDA